MAMHATAIFADRHSAHAAIEQLAQAGFARDAISVAMSEATHEHQFGVSRSGGAPRPRTARYEGVLGAIVAVLATVATPGEPVLRVGGPLVAALLRAGTLSIALLALGMAEPEAQAVRDGLREGGIVVGVRASGARVGLAKRLLELSGGMALRAA